MKLHIISKFGLIGMVMYITICTGFFVFAINFCKNFESWSGWACIYISFSIPAMPWILWEVNLFYSLLINLVVFYIIGMIIEKIIKKRKHIYNN